MAAYKKILVAVDVGTESEQVLQAALDIAKDGGGSAEINVIHVLENYLVSYNLYGYTPPIDDGAFRDQVIADLSSRLAQAGLPADCLEVLSGNAVSTITHKAQEQQADLIVVGSHGRHGIKLLLGSTANGVLHHAHCNVLAVRIRGE
jgi:universal stress protein A